MRSCSRNADDTTRELPRRSLARSSSTRHSSRSCTSWLCEVVREALNANFSTPLQPAPARRLDGSAKVFANVPAVWRHGLLQDCVQFLDVLSAISRWKTCQLRVWVRRTRFLLSINRFASDCGDWCTLPLRTLCRTMSFSTCAL